MLTDMYKNKKIIFGFIVIFSAIGTYLIFSSHAAGPYASVEPESGTLSNGASSVSDSNASNGSYVQFGTTSTINPTPTGPATPSGGWHVDLADDFNAQIGTGSGEDNIWYPSQSNNSTPTNTVSGDNPDETEGYNSSQVSVSNGNLVLTAKYQNDVLPASSDGHVQRNYVSGIVSSTNGQTSAGYKGFDWTPDNGSTWAFEVDAQWPVDTGELWNAWWTSSDNASGWINERDFFEGHHSSGIDSDWIYQTGTPYPFAQDYYNTTLSFNPATSMHRYTYVIYPNQSWSLYIDGALQTWVGNNGIAPVETGQNVPMMLILNYALDATTFTSGTRSFLINSVAVYQDNDHAGLGTTGGGIAPGTVIGD